MSFRQVALGLAVTIVLAVLFLKIPQLKVAFAGIGDAVDAIAAATEPAPRSCSAISAAGRCRSS